MKFKDYVHQILDCDYEVVHRIRRDASQLKYIAKIDGNWDVVEGGILRGVVGFGNTQNEALKRLIAGIEGKKITQDGWRVERKVYNVPDKLTLR